MSNSSVWAIDKYICLWLPPDWTRRKVNYSGDLGEGKVVHEPKLESYWSVLVITPLSAMWAWWTELVLDLNLGPGTYAWL